MDEYRRWVQFSLEKERRPEFQSQPKRRTKKRQQQETRAENDDAGSGSKLQWWVCCHLSDGSAPFAKRFGQRSCL